MKYNTLSEFLRSEEAKKYKEENFSRLKEDLKKMCIEGNWPIANNEAALDAITNDNLNHVLIDLYERTYKKT
jgi:hypothetical protein